MSRGSRSVFVPAPTHLGLDEGKGLGRRLWGDRVEKGAHRVSDHSFIQHLVDPGPSKPLSIDASNWTMRPCVSVCAESRPTRRGWMSKRGKHATRRPFRPGASFGNVGDGCETLNGGPAVPDGGGKHAMWECDSHLEGASSLAPHTRVDLPAAARRRRAPVVRGSFARLGI